jgi:hypothetical protein
VAVGKKVALVLAALLLIGTVGGSNVVMTGERTVLSASFVDQWLTEENGYEELREVTVETIGNQIGETNLAGSGGGSLGGGDAVNTTSIVEAAVTTEYVRNQSRANTRRVYEFLHGDRENPALRIDIVPLKSNLANAVGDEIQSVSVGDVIDQFVQTPDEIPIEVSGDRLQKMRTSEQNYKEVRQEVRAEIRTAVLDRLVDNAFDVGRSENPDGLLLLIGQDPRQYPTDQEKRAEIDSREEEIRGALRTRIKEQEGDNIEQAVDQQLADTATQVKEGIRQGTGTQTDGLSENATTAVINLQLAVVDGLATDTSYTEFTNRIDTAEQNLIDEAARLARLQINEELPDSISLTERLPSENREQLNMLAELVQQIDIVNIALPVVALALIGLAFAVSRSLITTALTTGVALVISGVITFVGAMLAAAPVEQFIRDTGPVSDPQQIDIAVGLVSRILGTLGSQSLILIAVGGIFIAIAIAERRGYLPNVTG